MSAYKIGIYFFLRIAVESRCKSKPAASSTEKFDYIARLGRHKDHPSELSMLCSGNMPGWVSATDVRGFWKAVDKYERSNGVLCQRILFVLPRVLSEEQKVALTEKFVKAVIGDRVLPYTYAIHEINGINPHCHLIFSERMNDGLDRTPKTWFKTARLKPEDRLAVRPLISPDKKRGTRKANLYRNSGGAKKYYSETRKLWEKIANEALEKAGRPERIDCRTFEEQGIRRITQIYLDKKVMEMEKRGVTTQKGKLHRWTKKANNRIESIKKIEGSSNHEYEMNMFMLGEIKTLVKKYFGNSLIEEIQGIIKEFLREKEERMKKNITDIRSKIDKIKGIKEMIERDALEWEQENKRFDFVWKKIKEFESMIDDLRDNARRFDKKQEKRIECFVDELSDCISERYSEKELNDYIPGRYSEKEFNDRILKDYLDKELKDYRSGIDFGYDGNNRIIELGEKNLREQYLERIALAKYHEQLNQAKVKNPPVEGKESDTAEKTGQKEDQKRTEVVIAKGCNSPKINELIKEGTPHFVESRGKLVDGYPSELDKNDYYLTKDGTAKLKNTEQKEVDRHDTKQVATTEKIEQKNDQEIPPMPPVVYDSDDIRINDYMKNNVPFLVRHGKDGGSWYDLTACGGLKKEDFEVDSEGGVKRKGIEQEAVKPLPNLTPKPGTKQVESHLVDEDAIAKEAKNGKKEDKETPEDRKERLKNMPHDEFIEEMRNYSNLEDKKTKTEQSKIEQSEQDKTKQPEIKQTKGLEAEQEEDERKKAKRKKAEKVAQEKAEAIELDKQAKTNETENEQSKVEQDETKQPEIEQGDKAAGKEDNEKLTDETGSASTEGKTPKKKGPGKGLGFGI